MVSGSKQRIFNRRNKKWLRIEILPGWFSFYPAFLGVSTKTEFYSFVFKTSLEFEDQHMF